MQIHSKAEGTYLPVLGHATDEVAAAKHSVDVGNYEAATTYFPICFARGKPWPDIYAIGGEVVKIDDYAPRVQYIFLWKVPEDAPIVAEIGRYYDKISDKDGGRVYRRR